MSSNSYKNKVKDLNKSFGPSPDWQLHKTLWETNSYMLDHQVAIDVNFEIEMPGCKQCTIGAHKYMLISRSPVFYAMFCGDLAEDTVGKPIKVIDVHPDAFIAMLKYIYCDEVKLCADTVLPILYASKKYLIPALTDQCTSFLEESMQEENVCLIYEQSMFYDEPHLVAKSKNFIETRTEDVLHSPAFLELPQHTLMKVLVLEKLSVTELDLFKICILWAVEECKRNGLEPTGEHQRKMLGDALFLLRFPTLELKDFANIVAKADVLIAEEKCVVFEYLTCDDKTEVIEKLPFSTVIREQPQPSILHRFNNFSTSNIYSGDSSIMKMQCDRTILLKGFGVSGSMNYDPLAEVQVTIKQERNVLCNRSISLSDDLSGDTIIVILPETVLIKPEMWYTINVTFHFFGEHDQGHCRRGKHGTKAVVFDGVTFEFDRADSAGFVSQLLFCRV